MSTLTVIKGIVQLLLLVYCVEAGMHVDIKFISYSNPAGRDSDDQCCDWACFSPCDHRFHICLDKSNPSTNENFGSCAYLYFETGEYKDINQLSFGEHFNPSSNDQPATSNPIQLYFKEGTNYPWPGAIRVKVNILDDDTGHSSHDDVDSVFYTISGTADRSSATATPHRHELRGQRYFLYQYPATTLILEYKMYCAADYYGPTCTVHCVPRNDNTGHYTCQPDTGAKVCNQGWEGPNCATWYDDCPTSRCSVNSQCVDGPSGTYTCNCFAGFTGTYCEIDIDECASSPCQKNATCLDKPGFFQCLCPSGFLGPTCELHVCQVASPCLNGGTCYNAGSCLCPAGFTGENCETDLCASKDCQNGGICKEGMCICPKGFRGIQCDVDECSIKECHNNGTCHLGECNCTNTGYMGSACQIQINECESIPCQNQGDCVDLLKGYKCLCQYPYTGTNCEVEMSTTTTPPPPTTINKEVVLPTKGSTDDKDNGNSQGQRGESTTYNPVMEPSKHEKKTPVVPIAISMSILVILVLIAILLVLLIRRKRRKEASDTIPSNFENPVYSSNQSHGEPPPEYTANPVGNKYVDMNGAGGGIAMPSKLMLAAQEAEQASENPYATLDEVSREPPPYSLDDNVNKRSADGSLYDNLPARVAGHANSSMSEEGAVGGVDTDQEKSGTLVEEKCEDSDTEETDAPPRAVIVNADEIPEKVPI